MEENSLRKIGFVVTYIFGTYIVFRSLSFLKAKSLLEFEFLNVPNSDAALEIQNDPTTDRKKAQDIKLDIKSRRQLQIDAAEKRLKDSKQDGRGKKLKAKEKALEKYMKKNRELEGKIKWDFN
mmetsp:Transcript_8378/g.11716  ORF Transcript_8378/g.11716 Transcript_8378/m.11716 type:complete len:123 (-) Transcript_8378:705-1073(-)